MRVTAVSKPWIFFDIDGTLLDHDKNIPDSTREAIDLLHRQGYPLAIASGRAPFMFRSIRETLGIEHYVSINGQYVVAEGDVVYENPIQRNKLRDIVSQTGEYGHPLVFMGAEELCANADNHPHIQEIIEGLKAGMPTYNPDFHLNRPVYQVLLICRETEEQPYLDRHTDLGFIRWHEVATDILPGGGSKAEGIRHMLDKVGADLRHTIAFGDALNDLEMLQTVGTGVAMGNAPDIVKKAASTVTRPVDQDGIWHGLRQLGLI